MIAATSVHVLRVRPGSTILDANMLVETAKSIGNWALAAEQFLSSQPDDYFGRFGNISVNDVYTVKDVPDAVPPSPPVRDPGIHMHGMHAIMNCCHMETTMVHVGLHITWQLMWHAWCL